MGSLGSTGFERLSSGWCRRSESVVSSSSDPLPPVAVATAGVTGATYIFCLPGSPGACKDGWDGILVHQLDYRAQPCNFVEIMPRLDEHLKRGKARAK